MSSPLINSVAVLPFDLISLNDESAYLGEGIATELINGLSRLPELKVVAKTSSFSYRASNLDAREIAKKLNTSRLIEGSVTISDNSIKVSLQLVSGETGFQLWSGGYQKPREDLFDLIGLLTTEVIQQLIPVIKSMIRQDMILHHKTTPEVYDLYLKGCYHESLWTQNEMRKALAIFETCIAKDPAFAMAHVSLANCWSWLGGLLFEPSDLANEQSKKYITEALKLDDQLVEAHIALALIQFLNESDLKSALYAVYNALDLNSHHPQARFVHAMCLLASGRNKLALQELQLALQLDPLSPMINSTYGYALEVERRYEEAIAQFEKTLALDPDSDSVITSLCWTYLFKGDLDLAEKYFELNKSRVLQKEGFEVFLLVAKGELTKAQKLTAAYTQMAENGPSNREMSLCYIALGDMKSADRYIEQFYQEKSGFVMVLSNPAWKNFRESQYYRKYRKRMSLHELPSLNERTHQSYLIIKSNTQEELIINKNDLLYIQADGVYCKVVWEENSEIKKKALRITLGELEEQLINPRILRCHRSYLVNLDHPFDLTGISRKYFLTYATEEVPVSRSYEEELLTSLSK